MSINNHDDNEKIIKNDKDEENTFNLAKNNL